MDKVTVIGIMSGTSVDGLDILAAEFKLDTGRWTYRILKSKSIHYPESMRGKLIDSIRLTGMELIYLDHQFGTYIGKHVNDFCKNENIHPDIIASHGHTVFHQPESGITFQIGDGQSIFRKTGIKVVNDFRKIDVLRGGQGAPLVPVGDKLLFGNYEFCLNIGGFSNISYDNSKGERIAFDICPTNIVLNYLARKDGKDYDDKGKTARGGDLIDELLYELNALEYYTRKPPRSLSLEWVQKNILKKIPVEKYRIKDLMRTYVEHVAVQINASITQAIKDDSRRMNSKILVTGGGVFHIFLKERLKDLSDGFEYVIPDQEIIEFKEALIFAFLGLLRDRNEINIWKSVTGACQDSSAGTIHYHG